MRELDIFEQYLVRQRVKCLQQGHQAALVANELGDLLHIRGYATQAQLCDALILAIRELGKDPGKFIQEHLKERA
jgi:hypothetical protein